MEDAFTKVLSGQWVLEVLSPETTGGSLTNHFIVSGSDSSDGEYLGEVATAPMVISGSRWTVTATGTAGVEEPETVPYHVRLTESEYSRVGGLVFVLGAGFPPDFSNLVLRCRNLDPELNPGIPLGEDPDFTVPPEVRGPNQPCPRPETPEGPGPGHGGLGRGGPSLTSLDCTPCGRSGKA